MNKQRSYTSAAPSSFEKKTRRPAADTSVTATRAIASCPMIGIGASSGGLEAIIDLLARVPPATGMAFLVVRHLAPNYERIPPQPIAHHTAMPVLEARQNLTVEPDHVDVIQPNVSMTVSADD